MKKFLVCSIIIICILFVGAIFLLTDIEKYLPGNSDVYNGKRPCDSPGTKWSCEEYMWFEIPEDYEENTMRIMGKMLYKGEEINISVRFQKHGSRTIFIYNEDKDDGKRIADGVCDFSEEKLIIKFDEDIFGTGIKEITLKSTK